MHNKIVTILSLCSLFLLGTTSFAQELFQPRFQFQDALWNYSFLEYIPLPTGIKFKVDMPVASLPVGPLSLQLWFQGGNYDARILRDPVTGDPRQDPGTYANAAGYRYNAATAQWAFGLTQGFLPRGEYFFSKKEDNQLELFLLYRGRVDHNYNEFATTAFSDIRDIFTTAIIGGISYNGVDYDEHRVKSGWGGELSYELSPSVFNQALNTADFSRLNFQIRGYYPLWSTGQSGDKSLNQFSSYLAGYINSDFIFGNNVPIYVLQSLGGRDIRPGMGGIYGVRGYPKGSYDAAQKQIASGEWYFLGPALFGYPWLIPQAYAFVDIGAYQNFPHSQHYSDNKGYIASTGIGAAISVIDFALVGAYAGYLFPGSDRLFPIYKNGNNLFLVFDVHLKWHF